LPGRSCEALKPAFVIHTKAKPLKCFYLFLAEAIGVWPKEKFIVFSKYIPGFAVPVHDRERPSEAY
jgi:hypothetical protein